MECVAHYNLKDTEYSDLKSLSENQYQRLLEAKRIRQGSIEQNQHSEQCLSIPDNGFDVNKHGVHLNPCYKKFTLIISSDQNVNQNHRQEYLNEKELMRHRPNIGDISKGLFCMQTKSKNNKEKDLLSVHNYKK